MYAGLLIYIYAVNMISNKICNNILLSSYYFNVNRNIELNIDLDRIIR